MYIYRIFIPYTNYYNEVLFFEAVYDITLNIKTCMQIIYH
jgi:hypothetical protein